MLSPKYLLAAIMFSTDFADAENTRFLVEQKLGVDLCAVTNIPGYLPNRYYHAPNFKPSSTLGDGVLEQAIADMKAADGSNVEEILVCPNGKGAFFKFRKTDGDTGGDENQVCPPNVADAGHGKAWADLQTTTKVPRVDGYSSGALPARCTSDAPNGNEGDTPEDRLVKLGAACDAIDAAAHHKDSKPCNPESAVGGDLQEVDRANRSLCCANQP